MGCLLNLLNGCLQLIILILVLVLMIFLLVIGLALGAGVWWAEYAAWGVFLICFLGLSLIFMSLFVE